MKSTLALASNSKIALDMIERFYAKPLSGEMNVGMLKSRRRRRKIYDGGPNGDARLYKISFGALSAYQASTFRDMDTQASGHYGVADFSIGMATIYLNRTSQKMYILQYVNGKYYTRVI